MGTNYYLEADEPCKCCGRPFDRIHIGKSSAGWCFSLHIHPDQGINDLPDWWDHWTKTGAVIRDEYGETLTPETMLAVVCARFGARKRDTDHGDTWYAQNHGERGPWGLARHRKDGRFCADHGLGTYDLMVGQDESW